MEKMWDTMYLGNKFEKWIELKNYFPALNIKASGQLINLVQFYKNSRSKEYIYIHTYVRGKILYKVTPQKCEVYPRRNCLAKHFSHIYWNIKKSQRFSLYFSFPITLDFALVYVGVATSADTNIKNKKRKTTYI